MRAWRGRPGWKRTWDGAQRKAEEKRREREEAALRALAGKEAAAEALTAARLELEALRLLLERVGRRERIKAQRARARHCIATACPHAAAGGSLLRDHRGTQSACQQAPHVACHALVGPSRLGEEAGTTSQQARGGTCRSS